jgi:HlyD family secretion protein
MATTSPRKNRKLLYILIGVVAVLIAAGIYKARQKPKGEEVTVEQVSRRSINGTVSASGKIFPKTEVKISSDVSGEEVRVDLYVKEGDLSGGGSDSRQNQTRRIPESGGTGKASLSTARAQRQITSSNVRQAIPQI